MPSIVEILVVTLIVGAAIWFVWRMLRKDFSGKTSSCGCGCAAGDCPSHQACASACKPSDTDSPDSGKAQHN